MINYASLMTKATLLRRQLGESVISPIDIFALTQRIDGLTIVYYPMGANISGMCVKGEKGNVIIAINSLMTLGRRRFSMAHELYHLYFDESMVSVCSKIIDSAQEKEKEADIFASYFLMPSDSLTIFINELIKKQRLTINDVIRIQQYFGVSHQATVYRLLNDGWLTETEANDFLKYCVRSKARLMGFSEDLYLPLPLKERYMTYGNYIKQAEELLLKGLISDGKYEELMLNAFRTDLVYGDENEDGDLID